MRVAVVGCGMIAQEHLRSIKLCPQAQIVGIADPNPQVLQVTADKWGIAERFTDPATLIAQTKPDVVHIATPPDTHYALTRLALEAGCHVYVEKPVTLRSPEAPELVELAARKGKMLCIGYMHIFDRVMLEAQRLVREGAIGKLCGIESYYGFDLGTTPGGRYFTQAYTHWAYKLPGGLFQNGLDHPLSVVMPFMPNPTRVFAAAAEVGVLPKGVPGELRIMLAQDDLVATVTLSEAASPRWHYLTLLGTEGTLKVDLQNKRVIRYAHKHGIPHFVTRAWMNVNEGLRVLGGTVGTFVSVLRKKFTPYEGMQRLVAEFYKAIETRWRQPDASRVRPLDHADHGQRLGADDPAPACRDAGGGPRRHPGRAPPQERETGPGHGRDRVHRKPPRPGAAEARPRRTRAGPQPRQGREPAGHGCRDHRREHVRRDDDPSRRRRGGGDLPPRRHDDRSVGRLLRGDHQGNRTPREGRPRAGRQALRLRQHHRRLRRAVPPEGRACRRRARRMRAKTSRRT